MKKILKFFGVIVCAIILFSNVNYHPTIPKGDLTLSKLTKVNEADAECMPVTEWTTIIGSCEWDICWNPPYLGPPYCEYF